MALTTLVDAVHPVRQRRGRPRKRPKKLYADKGYDFDRCRRDLRQRGIAPRIARRGIDSSAHLGKHRWVVERSAPNWPPIWSWNITPMRSLSRHGHFSSRWAASARRELSTTPPAITNSAAAIVAGPWGERTRSAVALPLSSKTKPRTLWLVKTARDGERESIAKHACKIGIGEPVGEDPLDVALARIVAAEAGARCGVVETRRQAKRCIDAIIKLLELGVGHRPESLAAGDIRGPHLRQLTTPQQSCAAETHGATGFDRRMFTTDNSRETCVRHRVRYQPPPSISATRKPAFSSWMAQKIPTTPAPMIAKSKSLAVASRGLRQVHQHWLSPSELRRGNGPRHDANHLGN